VWTENAANSKWVNREITRADDKNKKIIPLVFDDAEITPIVLQRVQYLDFRKGYYKAFNQLVSLLIPLIESELATPADSSLIWQPAKRPFARSFFLEQNNYLDRESNRFARNTATERIVDRYGEVGAKNIFTLVAIPFPNEIDFDINSLPELTEQKTPLLIQTDENTSIESKFGVSIFSRRISTQSEDYFYYPHQTKDQISSPKAVTFLRFTEHGSIESGECNYSFYYLKDNSTAVNFVFLLGMTFKFLYLAANVYRRNGYNGRFQMLFNLANITQAKLGNFAFEGNNLNRRWSSVIDSDPFSAFRFVDAGQGVSYDRNIQIICNVEVEGLLMSTSAVYDILHYISNKLQKAFNYDPQLRHLTPDTKLFPWHQFSQYGYFI
jgi:hypothetical protein